MQVCVFKGVLKKRSRLRPGGRKKKTGRWREQRPFSRIPGIFTAVLRGGRPPPRRRLTTPSPTTTPAWQSASPSAVLPQTASTKVVEQQNAYQRGLVQHAHAEESACNCVHLGAGGLPCIVDAKGLHRVLAVQGCMHLAPSMREGCTKSWHPGGAGLRHVAINGQPCTRPLGPLHDSRFTRTHMPMPTSPSPVLYA